MPAVFADEDQYQVLYVRPRSRPPIDCGGGTQFGQGGLVARGVALWENTLGELFDTFARYPTTAKLATDCILLAVHAVVSVPNRLLSRNWTPSARLAQNLADLLLSGWRADAAQASAGQRKNLKHSEPTS